MSLTVMYVIILLVIFLVFGTAAYAGMRAAPWLPVFKKDIDRIIQLAQIKDDDLVYDLGCGDGRVIAAMANNTQAQFVGYEVSFLLYLLAKLKIIFLGLSKRVEIRYADFLRRDLGQAKIIFCFLTPMAMKKLAPKFKKELKKGTRIISYSFSLPDWQPRAISRLDDRSIPIYYYVVD